MNSFGNEEPDQKKINEVIEWKTRNIFGTTVSGGLLKSGGYPPSGYQGLSW